jgi:hypothetical protein
MDLNAVKQRFVEIEAPLGITGYVNTPHSIPETDLPVALHFVRSATHESNGSGILIEKRLFLIRVFIVPLVSGVPGESESIVEPYLDRVLVAFGERPGLSSSESDDPLEGIQTMKIISDSGVTILPYPDAQTKFLGLEFTVQVMAVSNTQYVNKE